MDTEEGSGAVGVSRNTQGAGGGQSTMSDGDGVAVAAAVAEGDAPAAGLCSLVCSVADFASEAAWTGGAGGTP